MVASPASDRRLRRGGSGPELEALFAVRVLVVIPTLNEAAHIATLVHRLLEDTRCFPHVKLVVADGGSSDGTVRIVQELARDVPELSLVHNPARLQSAGVNLAARQYGADADVLIRCDAHAFYPDSFCARLIERLLQTGADAVVVPLDTIGVMGLQPAVACVSNSWLGTGGSSHRAGRKSGFVDHGHHALFRMDMFRKVGGYDESFAHNEDAELDCRQRALGAKVFLDAEIRVSYEPRSTMAALWKQYFRYGAGRSRTARRHRGSIRLRQLAVPAHFLFCATALLLSPWFTGFLLWPVVYIGVLLAASLVFSIRDRSVHNLWVGPVAAIMHTAWACGFLSGLLLQRERRWSTPWLPSPAWNGQRNVTSPPPLRALLVDPSLFTAPYDAALTEGLIAAGVHPTWAVRPIREGDRQEIAIEHVDAFFYRRVDRATWLPKPLHAVAKGFSHVLGLSKLVARVVTEKPDVVHFQWSVVPVLDALAMAVIQRRCPIVLTVHDTVPFNGERPSRLQNLAFFLPLRFTDRVIVHTKSGRDTLIARGIPAHKVTVIPHGPLRLSNSASSTTERERTDRRWTFLLFGEIKHYKGFDLLVEALGLLPKSVLARARFVVAGRPRIDIQPIVARIAELGLEGAVELWPRRLSEAEMAELFANTDCFLFPYRQIDASGVYFLVKSYSKWIIASRLGVFAEDLRDGLDGALIAPEDPHLLAAAIAYSVDARSAVAERAPGSDWVAIGHATRDVYENPTPNLRKHAS